MPADLLLRKKNHFVLWRPRVMESAPSLYIGSSSDLWEKFQEIPLKRSGQFPEQDDLWEVPVQECNLTEGQVYFYWFKVWNTDPYDSASAGQILYCTDPTAWTIDRGISAPVPSEPGGVASLDPASVVLYQNGELIPCDPEGKTVDWEGDTLENLPPNNRLVIYELPTRWTRIRSTGEIDEGNGTFRDVLSLLGAEDIAPTFPKVRALNNRAHLVELGANVLELLPPADSDDNLNWGYDTK